MSGFLCRLLPIVLVASPLFLRAEPETNTGGESVATEVKEAASEGAGPLSAVDAHRSYLEQLREDDRFPSAASCAQCHQSHYEEWAVSPHAYAMMSPIFNALHMFTTHRTSGTQGDFCIRCHSPVAFQREEPLYSSVLLRPPVSQEGVTCVVCHRVDRDYGTASGRPSLHEGPLTDPIYGSAGNTNLKAALANSALGLVTTEEETGKRVHEDVLRFPTLSDSALCGSCHDVLSPNGFRLETAFTHFKNSPASKNGQSCQDCHMGVQPGMVLPNEERYGPDGRDLNYRWEPAAQIKASPHDSREGIPTPPRKRTNHMFIGPDYSIVHPGIFPHNLEAREFTWKERFDASVNREIAAYVRSQAEGEEDPKEKESIRERAAPAAAEEASRHVLTDWLSFRWKEGWGTPRFEEGLADATRKARLRGVGFPWEDRENPDEARLRRIAARLILDRQFNRLNDAHVARVRLLRRAFQLDSLEFLRNSDRGLAFRVLVRNATDGHAAPTGFDAERILFLEVTVRDAENRVLFRSGDRDPNGDLRDLHSAYVHAQAKKEGPWLEASHWKSQSGLPLTRDDKVWDLDRHLFTLQTRFLTSNVFGGEREQIVPVNYSVDPLPFIRPTNLSTQLTGRNPGARKHQRVLPPLGSRWADYRLRGDSLTPARPYRIQVRFVSQMVPVNLVKEISSVGFDYNLSAREVARRLVDGAAVLWDHTFVVPVDGSTPVLNLRPDESAIQLVSAAEYPFPHTTEEDLKRRSEALQKISGEEGDLEKLEFQPDGAVLPPQGVPEGVSLLPPEAGAEEEREKAASEPKKP